MNNLASASIYTDFGGLEALKAQAVNDEQGSLDTVAQQFEAMLMQQMLKAMRQASMGEGLLDSDQSLFYRDMYDQQLAIHLAESGGLGMAEIIKRQLSEGQTGPSEQGKEIDDYPRWGHEISVQTDNSNSGRHVELNAELQQQGVGDQAPDTRNWQPVDFVKELMPWARKAAALLGLQPQALLAQAALETGWGRHIMRFGDGQSANNLFGIKADQRWDGNKVAVNTLEYENGAAVKKRAFFRAYDSLGESFLDYAEFVSSSPRYQGALAKADDPTAYFIELQQAGYATDPEYASKIKGIMSGSLMKEAMAGLKAEGPEPL
ncbi:flagellar assembly peptidoglycan hydrolase FlgJ [Solemya velesiana gill symbiont]|uniref:Peptidoglycan hydrolase FlgJ n=1 Tax=Solemya velesiana gill symbiont TaxID=1918948 RepID=A0A1T2KXX4_9GAMM|nr:flagellar assembly peptidoglycan hydrolase FlgJ [Solemya velesiana gill symbiont]OOZ37717.1 flagellar rod assembly protein/muramidase FlgJ [Solemya velesiana gill symbiont]